MIEADARLRHARGEIPTPWPRFFGRAVALATEQGGLRGGVLVAATAARLGVTPITK